MGMRKPTTVKALEEFGRVRLSRTFFMRDFLFSDIAAIHGLSNVPDDPDLAITAGTRLCEDLLEPLQDTFGRIVIRSAYRSPTVNAFGNRNKLNCASNEANAARHIWDSVDAAGLIGATACVVVPAFWDRFQAEGDWKRLAWWVHDHLPYSEMEFFRTYWAFNLSWHQAPKREITNWIEAPRTLTKPGMGNHNGSHGIEWRPILEALNAPIPERAKFGVFRM